MPQLCPFPLVRGSDWCGEYSQACSEYRRTSAWELRERPKPGVTDPRLVVSKQEAARMLGISDRTLHTLTHEGKLPCMRVSARVCYSIETLRRWVAEQER